MGLTRVCDCGCKSKTKLYFCKYSGLLFFALFVKVVIMKNKIFKLFLSDIIFFAVKWSFERIFVF